MNRNFEQWHGGDRNLCQLAFWKVPGEWLQRSKAFVEFSEKLFPLSSLFGGQLRRHEVIHASERTQIGRKRRAIVFVSSTNQDLQQQITKAESGSSKANWALTGDSFEMFFGLREFADQFLLRVQMQPRLMIERVVTDLVPGG